MVNPRMAATSAAISIIALSSLIFGGAGLAGAASPTAAGTSAAGTSAAATPHAMVKHVVCKQHAVILRQMRRSGNEYANTTATYRVLLNSARKSGQSGLAAYWANVMAQRHAHQVQSHADLIARKAQYQAADQISGAC